GKQRNPLSDSIDSIPRSLRVLSSPNPIPINKENVFKIYQQIITDFHPSIDEPFELVIEISSVPSPLIAQPVARELMQLDPRIRKITFKFFYPPEKRIRLLRFHNESNEEPVSTAPITPTQKPVGFPGDIDGLSI